MQSLLQKKEHTPSHNIAEAALKMAKDKEPCSDVLCSISISFQNILQSELPDMSIDLMQVINIMTLLGNANKEFAKHCQRFADDLRDIREREKIIQRLEKEADDAFKATREKGNTPHAVAVQRARQSIQKCIDAKRKYPQFKKNRLHHAFVTYGQALYELSQMYENHCTSAISRIYDERNRNCSVISDPIAPNFISSPSVSAMNNPFDNIH